MPRQSKCNRARRLPSTSHVLPEALTGSAPPMPSTGVLLMRWLRWQVGGHLDPHRGPPDDPRVKSPAVTKVAWMWNGTDVPLHFEHAAAQQSQSHIYCGRILPPKHFVSFALPEALAPRYWLPQQGSRRCVQELLPE